MFSSLQGRIGSESGPPNWATETSGPYPAVLLSQHHAKPPGCMGSSRVAGAKSLQPQTTWRWAQSAANPSLELNSLIRRENTGNSAGFEGIASRRGSENAGLRSPPEGFPWTLEQGTTAQRSGSFPLGIGKPKRSVGGPAPRDQWGRADKRYWRGWGDCRVITREGPFNYSPHPTSDSR
jgi:hypothetical protein